MLETNTESRYRACQKTGTGETPHCSTDVAHVGGVSPQAKQPATANNQNASQKQSAPAKTNASGSATPQQTAPGSATRQQIAPQKHTATQNAPQKQTAKRNAPQKQTAQRNAPQNGAAKTNSRGNQNPYKLNKSAGSQPHSKCASVDNTIARELNVYRFTKMYKEAVSKTFLNKAALDQFNKWALDNDDQIDPAAYPVCHECGNCSLKQCDCLITGALNAVNTVPGAALVIPRGAANIKWRFAWVDQIKRMFIWPTFNPDADLNHNIGWLSSNQMPEDALLVPSLLAYIRQHQNTSYKINGVLDRNAKLAHSKKLALRYFDEQKVPMGERTEARFVNCMHFTVQKACDSVDDDFLLAYNNEDHSFWSCFPKAPVSKSTVILIAALISPVLLSKLVHANMRLHAWMFQRLLIANARTLVYGSVLAVKSATQAFYQLGIAVKDIIWSGIFQPSLSEILQWLCNTAHTTWSTVSDTDISRLRPNLTPLRISASGLISTLSQSSGRMLDQVMRVAQSVPTMPVISMPAEQVSTRVLFDQLALLTDFSQG